MGESRQVIRALARANDYWTPGRQAGGLIAIAPRACRRENATGRDRTSCNIIAAKARRKRLSPKPEARYAKGSKHAWQRKKAFWDAVRKTQGIAS
jgi:hypothetical protein